VAGHLSQQLRGLTPNKVGGGAPVVRQFLGILPVQ